MIPVFSSVLTCSLALVPAGWPTLSSQICLPEIDAEQFYESLIDRYQLLSHYEDHTRVVYVTQRDGEPEQRIETALDCELDGDDLRVDSASSAIVRHLMFGRSTPDRPIIVRSPAMASAELRYKLSQAPHMALRFVDSEACSGADSACEVIEGLEAVTAERVTVDERSMVHLELTRSGADDADESADEDTIDIYVNPKSMLIEQVVDHRTTQAGVRSSMTLEITPITVVDAPVADAEDECDDDGYRPATSRPAKGLGMDEASRS